MKGRFATAALVLSVAAAVTVPTGAQAQSTKKQVQGYVAGGYVISEGDTAEFVDDGWNVSGGAIYRPAAGSNFALRFDLGYSWFDANSRTIALAQAAGLIVNDGDMSLGTLSAEAMYEFGGGGRIGGYIAAGIGGMRRYGQLTTTVPIGGIWCDPWTYYCYPGYVPGQAVVADDSLTKFFYSVAGGVTFPVGNGEMYVEARYNWMEAENPSTQTLPILLGYRF